MTPPCVEHKQQWRLGTSWCGQQIVGVRICGVEGLIYHEGGPVCAACIAAICDAIGAQVARFETWKGKP